jgi:phosphopantetheinyl transferase
LYDRDKSRNIRSHFKCLQTQIKRTSLKFAFEVKPETEVQKDNERILKYMAEMVVIKLNDSNVSYSDNFRVLSHEEKMRASRIRSVIHKRRFVISHGRLRCTLSEYTSQAPETIQILTTKQGKPYLDPARNPEDIQFSLSHSKDIAVVAVCRKGRIGVDVEFHEVSRPFMEIAGRYFYTDEVRFLEQLNAPKRRQAFYRIWTMKESWLKATGEGIAGLQTVETRPGIDENGTILLMNPNTCDFDTRCNRFQSRHFDPAPGYTACYTCLFN